MNQYKKLAKNSFLFAIGSFSSKAITFFLLPVYTRYLTPEQYGIIDVLITTLLLLMPLLSLQAQEISFRFSMDEDKKPETILMNSLLLCFSGFGFLLFLSPLLIEVNAFSDYLPIFLIILLLAMIDSVIKQFIRGIGKIRHFVISDVIYTSTFAISNIILIVLLNLGIRGYLLSLLFGYILSTSFLFVFGNVKRYISFNGIDLALIKPMLGYSIPLIPTAIMWWTINVSDRYLLSYFISFDANGIYAIASKIPIILLTLNTIFFRAWQITAIEGIKDPDFKNTFTKIFNSLTVILFILFSFLIIFLKPLYSVIASGDFFSGWKYVPFLLGGVIFSAYSQFWGTMYIASKRTVGALLTSGVGATLNVVLNIILIPKYGIYGAAIGTMLSFFIMWISRFFHIKNLIKINLNFKYVLINIIIIVFQVIALFNFTGFRFYTVNFILFLSMIIVNIDLIRNNLTFVKRLMLEKI